MKTHQEAPPSSTRPDSLKQQPPVAETGSVLMNAQAVVREELLAAVQGDKAAFRKCVTVLHPDRIQFFPAELQPSAERLFLKLKDVYEAAAKLDIKLKKKQKIDAALEHLVEILMGERSIPRGVSNQVGSRQTHEQTQPVSDGEVATFYGEIALKIQSLERLARSKAEAIEGRERERAQVMGQSFGMFAGKQRQAQQQRLEELAAEIGTLNIQKASFVQQIKLYDKQLEPYERLKKNQARLAEYEQAGPKFEAVRAEGLKDHALHKNAEWRFLLRQAENEMIAATRIIPNLRLRIEEDTIAIQQAVQAGK